MIDEIDIADLIEFARAWGTLGWAVQEQVEHLLDGTATSKSVNSNAIQLAYKTLRGYHEDLDSVFEKWLSGPGLMTKKG